MSDEDTNPTRRLAVCARCEDQHFRAYPEDPHIPCDHPDCQCWCMTG